MVSIIVPVLNEVEIIEPFLAHLTSLAGEHEIIVVDGGSEDGTAELAARWAQVIRSPRGRARQMNLGARQARGDILFFVHADSRLPRDVALAIEGALRDPRVVGGCLSLAIDHPAPIYRLIAVFSNLRVKLFGQMLGDQGIFARREVFQRLGGFPEMEIMEDWEFSARLRSVGRVVQLPLKITTSARRWQKCGVWRTIWLMQKIKVLYALGYPPTELRRLYEDVR
ncbi:MAG TPA: glycosyltransferase [Anaerolineae bacterium]|nr:glycosyltransferase [Anaerolineae bacterium]